MQNRLGKSHLLLSLLIFLLAFVVVWALQGLPPLVSAAAPSVVTNVVPSTASGQVTLTWTNPASVDFTGTMVRYSASSFPADTSAGILASDVAGSPSGTSSVTVSGLTNGTTYYFSLFSHNVTPEYSAAVNAQQLVMGVAFSDDFQALSIANIGGQNGWNTLGCTWTVVDTSGEKTLKSSTVTGPYETCRVVNGGTVATYSDQMIRADWKGSTTTTPGQVFLRAQSVSADAGGYFLWQSGGTLRINYKTAAGALQTQLASVAFTPLVDTWYTYEFSVVNNSAGLPVLTGYVWQRGTAKPSTPTLQVTDTFNRHSQGVFSVGKTGTTAAEYDNVVFYGSIGLSNVTATPGHNANTLSWTNPSYANYAGAVVRSSTTAYPTSITDGNAVGTVAGLSGGTSSIIHSGLTNGTSYYYTLFPYDNSNVYGTPVRLSQVAYPQLFQDSFTSLSIGSLTGQNGWLSIAGTWNVASLNGGNVVSNASTTTYPTNQASNANMETTDQVLRVRFQSDNATNTTGYVWLRHQSTGYGYIFWHNVNVWTISHYTAGGLVQLAASTSTAASPMEANVWFNMEASVINDQSGQPVLKLYVWKDGMEKPSTPTVVATDSVDRFVKGSFALGRNAGATTAYYDDVGFYGVAPMVTITSPAAGVAGAPNVATRAILDEGGTFYIPYIQTSTTLNVAASAATLTLGEGVKFVLNEGQAGAQTVTDLTSPYTASFTNLPKAVYTLDAYALQNDGVTPYVGAQYHDKRTDVGIGDIINVIGDSIVEGYYGTIDDGVVTSWLDADPGTVSADKRQFPQHGIGTGTYNESFLTDLNDKLAAYYGYPVFLMNEGKGGIRANNYQSSVMTVGWQNRQNLLGANKWIIMLGVNDNRVPDSPATFQTNITNLINVFINSYGATPDKIWLMYPFYDFGSGGQGAYAPGLTNYLPIYDAVRSNLGLQGGADFFNTFKNYQGAEYQDNVHPNATGYVRMARLAALAMMKPVFSTTTIDSHTMTLAWDNLAAFESTIAGYTVRYGTNSSNLDHSQTTNTNSIVIQDLEAASNIYFTVQAYDNNSIFTSTSDVSATVGPFYSVGGRSHASTSTATTSTTSTSTSSTTDTETASTTETSDSTTQDTNDSTTDTSSPDGDSTTSFAGETETPASSAEDLFSDVSGNWAEDSISELVQAGVIRGNPEGTFTPIRRLNRAETATMLWRLLQQGDPAPAVGGAFLDVPKDIWYASYVEGLYNLDLVHGAASGFYYPARNINKVEFLRMVMNVYLYLHPEKQAEYAAILEDGVTDAYADVSPDAWYAELVTVGTAFGFMHGESCGDAECFFPADPVTRAEAAEMLATIF